MATRQASHQSHVNTHHYPFSSSNTVSDVPQRPSTAPLSESSITNKINRLSPLQSALQKSNSSDPWFGMRDGIFEPGRREGLGHGLRRMFTRSKQKPDIIVLDRLKRSAPDPFAIRDRSNTVDGGNQHRPSRPASEYITNFLKSTANNSNWPHARLGDGRGEVRSKEPVQGPSQHRKKPPLAEDDIVLYKPKEADRPKRRATTATAQPSAARVAANNLKDATALAKLNNRQSLIHRLEKNDMIPHFGPTPYGLVDKTDNEDRPQASRRHSTQPENLQARLARQLQETQDTSLTHSQSSQQEVFAATSALQRMFSRRRKEVPASVTDGVNERGNSSPNKRQLGHRASLSFSLKRSTEPKVTTGNELTRRLSRTFSFKSSVKPKVTSAKPTKQVTGYKHSPRTLAGKEESLEVPNRMSGTHNQILGITPDSSESDDGDATPKRFRGRATNSTKKSSTPSKKVRASPLHKKSATVLQDVKPLPQTPSRKAALEVRDSQSCCESPGSCLDTPTVINKFRDADEEEEECLIESDVGSVFGGNIDGNVGNIVPKIKTKEIKLVASIADMYIGTLYGEYLSDNEDEGAVGGLVRAKSKSSKSTKKANRSSKRWSVLG
nr:hypothetical protein L204_00383 [Cryptococcus depauperatus CBS 7855]